MPPREITCFKAYDIRGRLGIDMDEDIAWRIGRAFAQRPNTERVVVGHDARESSPALAAALIRGLNDGGVDVLDIGLAGTEEMYFATARTGADGGIEVTASHNPIEYNGMKLIGPGAAPLDPTTELVPLHAVAQSGHFLAEATQGSVKPQPDARALYARAVCDFIDASALAPLRVVVNAGNGVAGPAFDAIAEELARRGAPVEFIRINHEPDSTFPNGVPNPILPENHAMTGDPVRENEADLGIAWDGDFDRCFFFDEAGRFIPGEYIVGLLAEAALARHPGEKIVHDPRVVMNTRDVIAHAKGEAILSKTGHAFVKQAMRESGAIYGGEMSAHHYFRDFYHADSGMIPALMILALVSERGQTLGQMVEGRMRAFPSSGEINFRLNDPDIAIARVLATFQPLAKSVDQLDGFSVEFDTWRFNLRRSNTEPVVRLNVESKGDADLVAARVAEISALLNG